MSTQKPVMVVCVNNISHSSQIMEMTSADKIDKLYVAAIHKLIITSAIKMNGILIHAMVRMNSKALC